MRRHDMSAHGTDIAVERPRRRRLGSETTKRPAAKNLKVTMVSNATNPLADQIALWPNDEHPNHTPIAA